MPPATSAPRPTTSASDDRIAELARTWEATLGSYTLESGPLADKLARTGLTPVAVRASVALRDEMTDMLRDICVVCDLDAASEGWAKPIMSWLRHSSQSASGASSGTRTSLGSDSSSDARAAAAQPVNPRPKKKTKVTSSTDGHVRVENNWTSMIVAKMQPLLDDDKKWGDICGWNNKDAGGKPQPMEEYTMLLRELRLVVPINISEKNIISWVKSSVHNMRKTPALEKRAAERAAAAEGEAAEQQ